jgi:hypothetical protein
MITGKTEDTTYKERTHEPNHVFRALRDELIIPNFCPDGTIPAERYFPTDQ